MRLWGLTDSCLWFDEIFSVHAAEHSWNELFPFVALDLIHPPLFYALLKFWISIGGESLLWLRSLPLILSLLAVVPFILLCREFDVFGWARVLGVFLFAVNGTLIKYSQEIRMYSLLLLLSLLSMWLFMRFFRRGYGVAGLIAVNLLVVYTHYFGWLVIAAEVASILMLQRSRWRQAALMPGIVALGFLPWAITVWRAAGGGASLGQNIGWMGRPELLGIIQFALDLIEPVYNQATNIDPASDYRVSVPLLLIATAALSAYFYARREREGGEEHALKLLLAFVCVPVGLAFIASWALPYSLWGTRHLIIVFAPFLILLTKAILDMPVRTLRTAAVSLIILFSGFALVKASRSSAPVYSWCNWQPLAVEAARTYPAPIYAFEDAVAYHLWFGLRHNGEYGIDVLKISNLPGVGEDRAYFLPRGFDEIKSVNAADIHEGRIWIAYRGEAIDETRQPLKTLIDAGYKIDDREVLEATREKTILLLLEKGA